MISANNTTVCVAERNASIRGPGMVTNGMLAAKATDKTITTPNAILRCCALAGMFAMRAGTSSS